jgi:hypothetical protein
LRGGVFKIQTIAAEVIGTEVPLTLIHVFHSCRFNQLRMENLGEKEITSEKEIESTLTFIDFFLPLFPNTITIYISFALC